MAAASRARGAKATSSSRPARTAGIDTLSDAGSVAAGLAKAGPCTAEAVAVAVASAPSPLAAARASSTALAVTERLAARLDVSVERLAAFAATAASIVVGECSERVALMALGLAATQTTTVTGPAATSEVTAERARQAAADGIEAVAQARHGFTSPEHPLTGRRGLLSLLAPAARTPSATLTPES